MLGQVGARGVYAHVAGMIVAWAMSAGKSSPAEPQNDRWSNTGGADAQRSAAPQG